MYVCVYADVGAIIAETVKAPQRVMDEILHFNGFNKVTDVAVDTLYEKRRKFVYPKYYKQDLETYETASKDKDLTMDEAV